MIEVPEFPILRGQDAIDALTEIISELEDQKGKELTVKQARAMKKFAKGLILSIKAEMSSQPSRRNRPKHVALLKRFEDALFPRLQLQK